MSYDRAHIAALVNERLRAKPTIRLATIAKDLQMDRHTISRALEEQGGADFTAIKTRNLDRVIRHEVNLDRPASIKEAAHRVGYSSGASLARKTRRAMGVSPTNIRRRR